MSLVLTLSALLLGTCLFASAIGLVGTALSVRAGQAGFSDTATGLVMASYFAGFVIGTYLGPKLIDRTGHVRAFAIFAALCCAAVLCHPIMQNVPVWALLRAINGIAVVGMYMVIESWLNEKSANEQRGMVLAAYQATCLISLAAGQYLLLVDEDIAVTPFLLAGALFALALVPVSATRIPEPHPVPAVRLNPGHLWRVSPLGVLGCAAAGLAGAVFYGLGPLFASQSGMQTGEIAAFMSVVILGGVALQWPLGHLSDLVDRRIVILAVSAFASVSAALLALTAGRLDGAFLVFSFFYGGAVSSLYPLCVAHSNDHTAPTDFIRTAGGLLLVYGLGAVAGPVVTGFAMERYGPGAFFAILSAMLGILTLVASWRQITTRGTETETHEAFVMLSRTSQSALEMLPESEQGPEQRS